MNGSVSLGEHDLVIESAQLSDDVEFQCQVTPAAGDPPLVGTARLSVIGESSPPSPPLTPLYTSLPTVMSRVVLRGGYKHCKRKILNARRLY